MLTGKNLIAGEPVDSTDGCFSGPGALAQFEEASAGHVERALDASERAFHEYRRLPALARARFLDHIAEAVEHSDDLVEAAHVETALPLDRLTGERARTAAQLRMFANLLREGSWADARIDRAIPDRKPLPKPDLRRMLIPIGPVVVFGASNFPLAFSVAGGDTASAFAAGCPVVVKSHPAHPATSELAARAIIEAVEAAHIPRGSFSLLQSSRNEIAAALVRHPSTKAVGFTGSQRAGRALFDVAASRPDPIPMYAEMGSVNPVFLLPGAVAERGDAIAEALKNSVTLGVGQFCTNPGVTIGIDDDRFDQFVQRMEGLFRDAAVGTMLYPAIFQSYEAGVQRLSALTRTCVRPSNAEEELRARPSMFQTDARTFMRHRELGEEVFGPSTVVVRCGSREEMEAVAQHLEGQLTATIHGTPQDLAEYASLLSTLENKAGRSSTASRPASRSAHPCSTAAHTRRPQTRDRRRSARPQSCDSCGPWPTRTSRPPRCRRNCRMQIREASGVWSTAS